MLLNELMRTVLPIKVIRDDAHNFFAEFTDPDGNVYKFDTTEIPKVDPDHPTLWSASFSTIGPDGKRTDKLIGGRKSIPIISTIMNTLKVQLCKRNVQNFYFEARTSEASRVSLYRALAKGFANQNGWFFHEEPVQSGYIIFTVSQQKLPDDFWSM